MTEKEKLNKETVLRFNKEVFQEGNVAVIAEIVHPDFVNHTAPGASGQQGLVDFTINILHKALKNIRIEIHDQVVEGAKVVTRKTIHGTHIADFMGIAPSGKAVGIKIIDIIQLNNGQYTDHWSIRDASDLINKSKNV